MKKFLMGSILALTAFAASAQSASLSQVYDYDQSRTATRVSADLGGSKPTLQVTSLERQYTRYGVGYEVPVATLGGVDLSVNGFGVYQHSTNDQHGFGLTVGASTSKQFTKSISGQVGVERFLSQDSLRATGNQASVGVTYKF